MIRIIEFIAAQAIPREKRRIENVQSAHSLQVFSLHMAANFAHKRKKRAKPFVSKGFGPYY